MRRGWCTDTESCSHTPGRRPTEPHHGHTCPVTAEAHLTSVVDAEGTAMITLGLILLILGFLIKGMAVLKTVGLVLILIGLFLNFVPIGGTRRRVF